MPARTTRETLTWRGRTFRMTGLSWGQEFNAGLPAPVAATSGYSVWGGSCNISYNHDQTQGAVNPWSDIFPAPGDTIVITVYVDGEQVAVYRPIVDSIEYALEGAALEFIMPTDRFSRNVRLPPVLQTHPQTTNPWGSDSFGVRYPAPTVLWAVAEAFRASGYHLTPPVHRSTVIDVSMQGAVWSNQWKRLGETVQVANYDTKSVAFPRLYGGDGILWMHDGIVYVARNDGRDMSAGFRTSFLVHKNNRARLEVLMVASPDWLSVVVDGNRKLWAFQKQDGKLLGSIEPGAWEGRTQVTVIYRPGTVTVHAGDASFTAQTDFAGGFTGLRVIAHELAGVAGVQVDTLATGAAPRITNFTPTARIKGGLFTSYMKVCLPSVRDEPASKILDEIAAATLASWWVDGDGIANFEDANSLTTRRPDHEIDSTEIGQYQISSELMAGRSSVDVHYSESTRSGSNSHAINLWSKGGTATAGDSTEEFVKPDENVEWMDPDFTFTRIASDIAGFNSRVGSWYGGAKNGASYDDPTLWASGYRLTTRAITPWVMHLREEFTESMSRSVYDGATIWKSLRGTDTPILRGRGLVTREDAIITVEGGLDNAPTLDVDCRKWVDRDDRAQEIGNYLMRFLSSPPPLLRSVEIPYSPLIKLGEAVKVRGYAADGSAFLFGAWLTCTVVGFTHSPDSGTTRLSLRVVAIDASAKTWRRVEDEIRQAGITWAQAEKSITDRGVTWAAFGHSNEDYGG